MLSAPEYQLWLSRMNLSVAARNLIDTIRSAPPSRRVRGGAGNVCGRYPSRKMNSTIQFESHRNELAAILLMEHDRDVLEFYEQPPPIKLNYLSQRGRRLGVLHTPDFFVLRSASCGWEEWKTEQRLCQLTQQSPHRYQRGPKGSWRSAPAAAVCQRVRLLLPFAHFSRDQLDLPAQHSLS